MRIIMNVRAKAKDLYKHRTEIRLARSTDNDGEIKTTRKNDVPAKDFFQCVYNRVYSFRSLFHHWLGKIGGHRGRNTDHSSSLLKY